MNTSKRSQYLKNVDYIRSEGLDILFDWEENIDIEISPYQAITGNLGGIALPPWADDLVRLHKIVRELKPNIILEFGVGYSTIIMANAIRRKIYCVDTSTQWIDNLYLRIPDNLKEYVEIVHSEVHIGLW